MKNSKVLQEALEVSDAIENFNTNDKNEYNKIGSLINKKKIKHLVTVARGSSDSAALFASYVFAKTLGISTYSLPPSVITLEKSKFDFSSTLVLIISQSGLSDDLIICSEQCKKMGAKILLLSNNPSSPIIKNTDFFFDMNTSKEISVAATKTYILSLVNIIKLVAITANQQEILQQLNHLPENIEKDKINDWDYKIIDKSISKGFIISRGMGFALSTEISLKFKELCLELIEPFSSAEVMHGPKTLIDQSLKIITLSLSDASGIAVKNEIEELQKYSQNIYCISSSNDKNADFRFLSSKIPEIDSILIMSKFYPMIIKYAFNKGIDADFPRYLSKVTKTI